MMKEVYDFQMAWQGKVEVGEIRLTIASVRAPAER